MLSDLFEEVRNSGILQLTVEEEKFHMGRDRVHAFFREKKCTIQERDVDQ